RGEQHQRTGALGQQRAPGDELGQRDVDQHVGPEGQPPRDGPVALRLPAPGGCGDPHGGARDEDGGQSGGSTASDVGGGGHTRDGRAAGCCRGCHWSWAEVGPFGTTALPRRAPSVESTGRSRRWTFSRSLACTRGTARRPPWRGWTSPSRAGRSSPC